MVHYNFEHYGAFYGTLWCIIIKTKIYSGHPFAFKEYLTT